jgi:hypothetical protein
MGFLYKKLFHIIRLYAEILATFVRSLISWCTVFFTRDKSRRGSLLEDPPLPSPSSRAEVKKNNFKTITSRSLFTSTTTSAQFKQQLGFVDRTTKGMTYTGTDWARLAELLMATI